MPDAVEALTGSPWVLLLIFAVAGLDAVLPFVPSESTVVAVGVAAVGTGHPDPAVLILCAAAGAFAGDQLAYTLGRRGSSSLVTGWVERYGKAKAVHGWVHGLIHRRGGLLLIFTRYVPGGRSTTMVAAGLVGYPGGRFRRWTAIGAVLWAVQAGALGYAGGTIFADRPLVGLGAAWLTATLMTAAAIGVQRIVDRRGGAGLAGDGSADSLGPAGRPRRRPRVVAPGGDRGGLPRPVAQGPDRGTG